MKFKKPSLLIISTLLTLTVGWKVSAGPLILDGNAALQKTSKLSSDINWYRVLSQAEAAAKQQGKLVFWVQMLGDIKGAT
jgi:hypothetical protein